MYAPTNSDTSPTRTCTSYSCVSFINAYSAINVNLNIQANNKHTPTTSPIINIPHTNMNNHSSSSSSNNYDEKRGVQRQKLSKNAKWSVLIKTTNPKNSKTTISHTQEQIHYIYNMCGFDLSVTAPISF